MNELIVNLHMHTTYSDGTGSHADLADSALNAGLDAIIVTDHNILVKGVEKYYQEANKRLLLIVGEEVHDPTRNPQKSHLLVFGANREMATYATDPQKLVSMVKKAGGISFIAHPFEESLEMFHEDAITWEDWQVEGYNGIELWNGLSELKSVIHSKADALFYALFPQYIARGPQDQTLKKWDQLLIAGKRISAVGGSDAHALKLHMGPLSRVIFPYGFHFSAINNHLHTPAPLSGDIAKDQSMILNALASGHSFIGYDLPAPTRGFRFTAQGKDKNAIPGDEITLQGSVTFQIRLPMQADCRLIHNGKVIKRWSDRQICAYIANQPGAYRVECYIPYLGQQRGWIFSNPIYVIPKVNGQDMEYGSQ